MVKPSIKFVHFSHFQRENWPLCARYFFYIIAADEWFDAAIHHKVIIIHIKIWTEKNWYAEKSERETEP